MLLALAPILGAASAPADSPAPVVEMRVVDGRPLPHVNGEPLPRIIFRGNFQAFQSNDAVGEQREIDQVALARAAGIRLFGINSSTHWWRDDAWIESSLRKKMEVAPDGFFFPGLYVAPSPDWANSRPTQLMRLESGAVVSPHSSVSSRPWRDEAAAQLRRYLQLVRSTDLSPRIIGLNANYQSTAENFYPGTHDTTFNFDYSVENTAQFRAWLRARHGDDVAALREAWNDPTVTFENATIPTGAQQATANGGNLVDPAGGGDGTHVADYFLFQSEANSESLRGFAAAVKDEDGDGSLFLTSWGYLMELTELTNRGAHLDVKRVFDDPNIPVIWAPISYLSRGLGGISTMHGPYDSLALRGKMAVMEEDSLDAMPGLKDEPLDAQFQALRRKAFWGMMHGFGMWHLDLLNEGRYLEPAYWDETMLWVATHKALAGSLGGFAPQVAVFVDDESLAYTKTPSQSTATPALRNVRESLARAGTGVGYYLLDDIGREDLPDSIQLAVFANAHFIEPADITRIQAWLGEGGRTALWVYAPGLVTPSGWNQQSMIQLTGIAMGQKSSAASLRVRVTNNTHPAAPPNFNRTFGDTTVFTPKVFVSDPQATTLGTYTSGGEVAFAIKDMGSWRSVFVGSPSIPDYIFREVARDAGVPVRYSSNDFVEAQGNHLLIHTTSTSGTRTLTFPPSGGGDYIVHELFSDSIVATAPGPLAASMGARRTYFYTFGSPDNLVGIFPSRPEVQHDLEAHSLRGLYSGAPVDWEWRRDGEWQADLTASTVPAARTSLGEIWRATARLAASGAVIGSAEVTIGREGGNVSATSFLCRGN